MIVRAERVYRVEIRASQGRSSSPLRLQTLTPLLFRQRTVLT